MAARWMTGLSTASHGLPHVLDEHRLAADQRTLHLPEHILAVHIKMCEVRGNILDLCLLVESDYLKVAIWMCRFFTHRMPWG
jgi:hypothetical protein